VTHKDIDQMLREEAEYAEAHKDAPLRDGTIITHKNQRSYVLSVRLSESERAGLERVAGRVGVPASSLARQWIAEKLVSHTSPTDVYDVADVLETMANQLRNTRNTGGDGEGLNT
jgi:hypothetical protein